MRTLDEASPDAQQPRGHNDRVASVGKRVISDTGFYNPRYCEGLNVALLAAGVQQPWETSHGPDGKDAGFRLVQAGFHFRTALMGMKRAQAAGTTSGEALKVVLDEREDQLLAFSGAKEAITAFASTLDLAAAAMFRLRYGAPYPSDPSREHDLDSFPPDAKLPAPLPANERAWLNQAKGADEMKRLREVRDMFTHRYFPRHLTIGAVFDHEMDLGGQRVRFGDLIDEFKAFVIDRMVAICAMYESP